MVPEVPTPTKVLFPNLTPQRGFEVGEVSLSKDDPLSVDLTMVPDSPTPTNLVVSSVVVVVVPEFSVDSSFSSLQEKTVRLKQKISKMNNPFFIFSSIPKVKYYGLVLGEPNIYHDSGVFYKDVGILLGGLSDCEELVGVVDVFYYEFVILLNLFDVPVVLQIQVIPF